MKKILSAIKTRVVDEWRWWRSSWRDMQAGRWRLELKQTIEVPVEEYCTLLEAGAREAKAYEQLGAAQEAIRELRAALVKYEGIVEQEQAAGAELTQQLINRMPHSEPIFDYLSSHDGPVVDGLEKYETVYAKNQPEYLPLRTLPGEDGNSAISRFHLTDAQRKGVARGADIYLEILHFKGPLSPSRVMVMSEPAVSAVYFREWWKAQTKGTYPVEELTA